MKKVRKILKENIKVIIAFILGTIITGGLAYADILYQGTNVGYDNSSSGLSATTVQGALDELYGMLPDTPFKLGDYFTLVPDTTTFTITMATTGYTSDQTITPSELTKWRVIDIHKDGSVDAISEYVSSTMVYFQGTTGYANFVGGLQTIAAQYAKAGYTIDTRMIGYGGQTTTIQTYSNKTSCASNATCKITTTYAFDGSTNTAPSTSPIWHPTTGEGIEYGIGVRGDTLYLKDIQLVGNVYKSDTSTYGDNGLKGYLSSSNTTSSYCLASRRFYWGNASNFGFNGRFINTNGDLSDGNLRTYYSSVWHTNNTVCAIRPIITLKSGVTISGGSGTKASPYTLN